MSRAYKRARTLLPTCISLRAGPDAIHSWSKHSPLMRAPLTYLQGLLIVMVLCLFWSLNWHRMIVSFFQAWITTTGSHINRLLSRGSDDFNPVSIYQWLHLHIIYETICAYSQPREAEGFHFDLLGSRLSILGAETLNLEASRCLVHWSSRDPASSLIQDILLTHDG